jgi:hypothetical protein
MARGTTPFSYCVGASPLFLLDISNSVSHLIIWHSDKDKNWKVGESFFDSWPRGVVVFPTVGSELHLRFSQSTVSNMYLWHSP